MRSSNQPVRDIPLSWFLFSVFLSISCLIISHIIDLFGIDDDTVVCYLDVDFLVDAMDYTLSKM